MLMDNIRLVTLFLGIGFLASGITHIRSGKPLLPPKLYTFVALAGGSALFFATVLKMAGIM